MSVLARFINGGYRIDSIDGFEASDYPAHDVRYALSKLNGTLKADTTDSSVQRAADNLNW